MMQELTAAEKEQNYDLFQNWLANMDDFLEEFEEHELVRASGADFDFSMESLNALEATILKRFPSFEDVNKPDTGPDINLFSIYLGETIRKNGGGKWRIDYEDPKNAYYGRPVLKEVGTKRGKVTCPMSLVTASTDRRKGDYLIEVARYLIQ